MGGAARQVRARSRGAPDAPGRRRRPGRAAGRRSAGRGIDRRAELRAARRRVAARPQDGGVRVGGHRAGHAHPAHQHPGRPATGDRPSQPRRRRALRARPERPLDDDPRRGERHRPATNAELYQRAPAGGSGQRRPANGTDPGDGRTRLDAAMEDDRPPGFAAVARGTDRRLRGRQPERHQPWHRPDCGRRARLLPDRLRHRAGARRADGSRRRQDHDACGPACRSGRGEAASARPTPTTVRSRGPAIRSSQLPCRRSRPARSTSA